ncbi:hypothetical protein, partial [uncultured Duncaniella sp.]|uniref:hypothetical protein n=1 Tax=uncultured Duncaniella sp. TaxID=2768039 RepID=UPI00261D3B1D
KSCKTARRGFTACLLLFLFKLVMESPLGLRSLLGFRSLGDSDVSLLYNYPSSYNYSSLLLF